MTLSLEVNATFSSQKTFCCLDVSPSVGVEERADMVLV